MNIEQKLLKKKEKLIESVVSGKWNYICFGAGKCFFDFINNCCIKKGFPLPLFVCDNNEKLWGKRVKVENQYIDIVSPEQIKTIDIDKTIIALTATLPMGILSDLTYKYRCIYYRIISAKSIETYYFVMDNKERLEKVYNMLEDEKSKECYEDFMNSLLAGNFFNQDLYTGNPYWNNDVITGLDDDEVIVHAGVFDGEDIRRALQENPLVEIHGFEPNKQLCEMVGEKYREQNNVKLYPFALGEQEGEIYFDGNGSSGAIIEEQLRQDLAVAKEKVSTVSIDKMFADKKVSLITLDVEGVEPEVLRGGAKVIRRDKPKMAVCVYHELEHYVSLAEQLKDMNEGYKFYFRQHSPLAIESVLYAI